MGLSDDSNQATPTEKTVYLCIYVVLVFYYLQASNRAEGAEGQVKSLQHQVDSLEGTVTYIYLLHPCTNQSYITMTESAPSRQHYHSCIMQCLTAQISFQGPHVCLYFWFPAQRPGHN